MRYRLAISEKARRSLQLLPKQTRQDIGYKIFLMQEDLAGDVKKLQGSENEYRLRVGNYRVMFRLIK
jgi:mRNA interferase RelE/StbE